MYADTKIQLKMHKAHCLTSYKVCRVKQLYTLSWRISILDWTNCLYWIALSMSTCSVYTSYILPTSRDSSAWVVFLAGMSTVNFFYTVHLSFHLSPLSCLPTPYQPWFLHLVSNAYHPHLLLISPFHNVLDQLSFISLLITCPYHLSLASLAFVAMSTIPYILISSFHNVSY